MPPRKRQRKVILEKVEGNDDDEVESNNNITENIEVSSPYFDKKKKSRREIHAQVAHKRAAHFARAPVSSSCPTGVVHDDSPQPDAEESWPGPFSTAHDMIKKREAAKKSREDAIARKDRKRSKAEEAATGDTIDRLLHQITANSQLPAAALTMLKPSSCVPTLSSLCIKTIANWWESVEELGVLPSTSLNALASELSKQRKLNPKAVEIMFPSGSQYDCVRRELVLPDCSSLTEECLFELLKSSRSQLEYLELKNCGHVFSSYLVDKLYAVCAGSCFKELHSLILTGIYRLADSYMSKFFSQLVSDRIRVLDLSYNSCLSHRGINDILHCGKFSKLTSLVLDYSLSHYDSLGKTVDAEEEGDTAQMKSENCITIFCRNHHTALPLLTSISLSGVTSISDEDVALLLGPRRTAYKEANVSSKDPVYVDIGDRLQELSLRECSQLSDKSVKVIRKYCNNLRTLDLSFLPKLSTQALLGLFLQEKYVKPMKISLNDESSKAIDSSPFSRSIGPLRKLSLEGLSKSVTDDVVIEVCLLGQSAGGGIQKLNISRCGNITDKSLVAISHHCSNSLEDLDISFVRSFSSIAVFHTLQTCLKLKQVGIWGCSQLRRDLIELRNKKELINNDTKARRVEYETLDELPATLPKIIGIMDAA